VRESVNEVVSCGVCVRSVWVCGSGVRRKVEIMTAYICHCHNIHSQISMTLHPARIIIHIKKTQYIPVK
jgi:hypothetical protein